MSKLGALLLLVCLASCYRVPDTLEPKMSYTLQEQRFKCLDSAFSPLSPVERSEDWGREMIIGKAFAAQLDLYRAISTFKRAVILTPKDNDRRLESQYDILLCYFLANKYCETVSEFEQSDLANVDKTFPAYHDLLLVLYESYRELCCPEKEQRIYELIQNNYPETAEKLRVSTALREGNIDELEQIDATLPHPNYLDPVLDNYFAKKKSVAAAQTLNAVPGLGYLYIGQKRSAVTAFILNGLFIAAAVEFFRRGNLPAGIITSSFEAGWYFGGIYGAGEEAKYYNERIYEQEATRALNDNCLFPALMLRHSF